LNRNGPAQIGEIVLNRREVRRMVNKIVLFMALYFVFLFVAAGIVAVIGIFASPEMREIIASVSRTGEIDPAAITEALGGGTAISLSYIQMAGSVAAAFAFVILRGKRFFTDMALPAESALTPGIFGIFVFAMYAAQFVAGLFNNAMQALLEPWGISYTGNYDSIIGEMTDAAGLLYIVLIGPVLEELVFRGAIMGSLRKFGRNFSIVISALIFGFFHMIFAQIPVAFLLGLILGYAAAKYSLRCSIALHILNNGVAMLFGVFGWNQGILSAVSIGCFVVCVLLLLLRRRPFGELVRTGAPPAAGVYHAAFSGVLLILYIVITAFAGYVTMIGLGIGV